MRKMAANPSRVSTGHVAQGDVISVPFCMSPGSGLQEGKVCIYYIYTHIRVLVEIS